MEVQVKVRRYPQTKRVMLAAALGGLGEVSTRYLTLAYVEVQGRLDLHKAGQVKLLPTTLGVCQAIQAEYSRRLNSAGSSGGR